MVIGKVFGNVILSLYLNEKGNNDDNDDNKLVLEDDIYIMCGR